MAGAAWAFGLNAVTFAASALLVLAVPDRAAFRPTGSGEREPGYGVLPVAIGTLVLLVATHGYPSRCPCQSRGRPRGQQKAVVPPPAYWQVSTVVPEAFFRTALSPSLFQTGLVAPQYRLPGPLVPLPV